MAKVATKSLAGAPQQQDIAEATQVYQPVFEEAQKGLVDVSAKQQDYERSLIDVKRAEAEAQGQKLQKIAEFQKGAAESERLTYEKAEREIAANPFPDFKPSEPDLRNYAQLGSLVMTMGIALGGAKGNALASIQALTGALQGWRQGRKDVYEKEIKKFQIEFNKVKATRDQIMKNLDIGLKKLAAGNKAGLADIEAAQFIAGSNSILDKQIKSGDYKKAYETAASTYKLTNEFNNKIIEMAQKIRAANEAKAAAQKQADLLVRVASIKASAKEGKGKPGAEVTKNYLGQNALLADMQDIAKSLKDPNIRKMIDDNRLESFASEEMGKIVSQIANDQLPSDLRKFLVKVRNVRNNYYLTISGKAITGGEAMRNYGVVSQPGDSAASMSDKTDSMINNVNRTIDQYQKLYGLPSLEAGMIDSLRTPTETSTFDVRSVPVYESQSSDIADAAKSTFGEYDPDKYDYRRNPETGRVQRATKE